MELPNTPWLAALSLGLALIALYAVIGLRRDLRNLPRPFWMGAWPPERGAILDGAYRYDHLPVDGLAPDMVHAILMADGRVGAGETLELLPERARLAPGGTGDGQCATPIDTGKPSGHCHCAISINDAPSRSVEGGAA